MHCLFCNNPLIDEAQTGIIDCNHCPNKTRYVCSGSTSKPEVWYIHVRVDPYLLEWNLVDEPIATNVYSGPIYKEDKFVMTLEKPLPFSQQEINLLLERLLKIKAFI